MAGEWTRIVKRSHCESSRTTTLTERSSLTSRTIWFRSRIWTACRVYLSSDGEFKGQRKRGMWSCPTEVLLHCWAGWKFFSWFVTGLALLSWPCKHVANRLKHGGGVYKGGMRCPIHWWWVWSLCFVCIVREHLSGLVWTKGGALKMSELANVRLRYMWLYVLHGF